MAYSQQNDTQYLDPLTGQYYTEQVYVPPMRNGYMSMGGFVPYGNMGMGGMFGNSMMNMPRTIRKNTGDISQVWKMMQNRQPYQYNVPTLASLFPAMTMPTMNNMQPTQYTGGAGQFLGGLLGVAPMASEAPASSGAGRFV